MKAALTTCLLCLLLLCGCTGLDATTSGSVREAATLKASQSVAEALGRRRPQIDVPSGPPARKLVVKDLIEGSGVGAKAGDVLTVEYFGIRYLGGPFADSWGRREPFRFRLGSDDPEVSPGWEAGLEGMRVGGRRELIVPPRLLYHGDVPSDLRPTDAVIYVIDLLGVS